MLIKNATRLQKMSTTGLKKARKRKKKNEGEREWEERRGGGGGGEKPLAIYFLCVLLPERQSADQQFV